MAVDTAQKRFSIMQLGSPWRGPMIVPSGTVDAGERLAFLYLYGGITAAALVEVPDVYGLSQAAAQSAIEAVGLVASFTSEHTSLQPIGFAFGQSPTAGSMVSSGSTVSVQISLGEQKTTGAGKSKKRRRKYEVEIDGEVYDVSSEAEAVEVLQQAKTKAKELARIAIERAAKAQRRPVRKVLADARKTLEMPEISASPALDGMVRMLVGEIEDIYQSALASVEIAAYMAAQRRREDEDDEDILLLL